MTGAAAAFTIRAPAVVHDTIDGEALIINLETGRYYTLEGVGAAAWHALEGGLSAAELAVIVAEQLARDVEDVADAVAALLGELLAEGLVRTSDGEGPWPDFEGPALAAPSVEGLSLRTYDELQELLLIDPIHEVDDAGWPQRAPTST